MIKHGNYKESETITFTTEISGVAISSKVAIGHYVNYDAGNWDATKDEAKIKSSGGTVTWNTTLPSLFSIVNGTFLGYLDKQSRNTNAASYTYTDTSTNTKYGEAKYSGWRVWSISGDIVTLISAGCPETYSHNISSNESKQILEKRDWSMYVNSYATNARALFSDEALEWYNRNFKTDFGLYASSGEKTNWHRTTFSNNSPIDILDNGAYYWLGTPRDGTALYYVNPAERCVEFTHGSNYGIRVLITLNSKVLVDENDGNGSASNPWKIVGLSS